MSFDRNPATLAQDEAASLLLRALAGRADDMAWKVWEIFTSVFPEALEWSADDQLAFVVLTKERFEALIAIIEQGPEFDSEFYDELVAVGADAARGEATLPQLLAVLRVSRDLVVQTAIELAEGSGSRNSLPLSLLVSRILGAMDRLGDALSAGYWKAGFYRSE